MPYGTFFSLLLNGVAESTVSDTSSDIYHTTKTISIHTLIHTITWGLTSTADSVLTWGGYTSVTWGPHTKNHAGLVPTTLRSPVSLIITIHSPAQVGLGLNHNLLHIHTPLILEK